MRRRWRLWLSQALLLAVGVAFLHPAIYWPGYGWVRGEPFYQGMPTSCWSSRIGSWQAAWHAEFHGVSRYSFLPEWVEDFLGLSGSKEVTPPAVLGEERASLAFCAVGETAIEFQVAERPDPQAVPVLMELLKDKSLIVRLSAATSLVQIGRQDPKVIEAILRALDQRDPELAEYVRVYELPAIAPDK